MDVDLLDLALGFVAKLIELRHRHGTAPQKQSILAGVLVLSQTAFGKTRAGGG
jgi:hypothetical protein